MKSPHQKPDPRETRGLIIAIVLSMLVIFGWQAFVDGPHRAQQKAVADAAKVASATAALPTEAEPATQQSQAELVAADLAKGDRVPLTTASLHGSINLRGGRIDDLTLVHYHESIQADSPEITLLSPAGTANPYYAEFGWQLAAGVATLPGRDTVWRADAAKLTPEQPLTLSFTTPEGLVFTRTIAVDEHYMFTLTDKVENGSPATVSLTPYGRVLRAADLNHNTIYLLHEGPLGVYGNVLFEDSYKDLTKKDPVVSRTTTGGWFGFTDKYWLVAMVPPQTEALTARTLHATTLGDNRFQSDFTAPVVALGPGESLSRVNHLFAGAKQVRMLDAYAKQLGIPHFDLAIDFGWFYFLTKPFFYALDILGRFLGNFGLGILLFTVMVKLALFPLANHGYVSMTRMKAVAPKIHEIRETYKNDQQRMSAEMMELYKREKINPLSGCWPIFIQIPIFFALYKVLYVTIEMRHAPFYGWIKDLSSADPTSILNLFGLLPYTAPSFLHIGVLPLLMGLTMWLQMRMNPPPNDETQKIVFNLMPPMFTIMMASFPAGLVLYWTWSNTLSILQQYVIMRRMHVRAFD